MRIGVSTLALSFFVFSTSSIANSNEPSLPASATSLSAASCIPPKAKPKPTPTPGTKTANPTNVVQVCAPVFSPTLVPALVPSDTSLPLPPRGEPLWDVGKEPKSSEGKSAHSIRIKLKNIFEADIQSSSISLVIFLACIFILYGAFLITLDRWTGRKKYVSATIWFGGAMVLGVSLYVMFLIYSPSKPSPETLDNLTELYLSGPQTEANESISRLERKIDLLRQEVRSGDDRLAIITALPSRAEAQPSTLELILLILVLGIWAATVTIAVILVQLMRRGVRSWIVTARGGTTAGKQNLPLEEIYRVEDDLLMLAMKLEKACIDLGADEKSKLPNPSNFLWTVDLVRRKLESPQSTEDGSQYTSPLRNFKFKENVSRDVIYGILRSLGGLNDLLMWRFKSKEKEWRPKAIDALVKVRRELIAVCEPISETSELESDDRINVL